MAYDNNISQILDDIIEHMTDGDITQEEEDELFALIDNIMIPSAKDFIVDTGTEGIWTYRKWNSGIAECWGNVPTKSVNCTKAWGSCFAANDTGADTFSADFPTGLFVATPTLNVTPIRGANDWWVTTQGHTVSATGTGEWQPTRATSKTLTNAGVMFQAIGKWK